MIIKQVQWLKSDKFSHVSTSGVQFNFAEFRVYKPDLVSWDTLGSFDDEGVNWSDGLTIEEDFILSDAANDKTAIKFGFRRDANGLTDEGYSLYLNEGKIGGTSWNVDTGNFIAREVHEGIHYTLRYRFRDDGKVLSYIKGANLGAGWHGVRIMDAGITSGKIHWHKNVAGIFPNDGTGEMLTSFTRWID